MFCEEKWETLDKDKCKEGSFLRTRFQVFRALLVSGFDTFCTYWSYSCTQVRKLWKSLTWNKGCFVKTEGNGAKSCANPSAGSKIPLNRRLRV